MSTAAFIKYRDGYKYQLHCEYSVLTGIRPDAGAGNAWVQVAPSGRLTIAKHYCWDGASGPAIDSKNFLRGSLCHDGLYQLMREGHLDPKWKDPADRLLQKMCIEDGMWRIRAAWVYFAVKHFGNVNPGENEDKPILIAPEPA